MSAVARCAFVGGGNMATALVTGLLTKHILAPHQVAVSSPSGPKLGHLGVTCTTSNAEAVAGADVVLICVKPAFLVDALASCKDALLPTALIISVVAGVSLATLDELLGGGRRIARVMPNTPCSIGVGASAFCVNAAATPEDAVTTQRMMQAMGVTFQVKEEQLNAVTGLSGSGPAFVFLFIEAMADGGVAAGLPREIALQLAAQTVRGAAALVQETGKHPGELKDAVASPAGTTIEGIRRLESHGFRGTVIDAVVGAAERASALSRMGK